MIAMLLDPVLNHLEDSVSLAVVGRRYEGATNKFINLLTTDRMALCSGFPASILRHTAQRIMQTVTVELFTEIF